MLHRPVAARLIESVPHRYFERLRARDIPGHRLIVRGRHVAGRRRRVPIWDGVRVRVTRVLDTPSRRVHNRREVHWRCVNPGSCSPATRHPIDHGRPCDLRRVCELQRIRHVQGFICEFLDRGGISVPIPHQRPTPKPRAPPNSDLSHVARTDSWVEAPLVVQGLGQRWHVVGVGWCRRRACRTAQQRCRRHHRLCYRRGRTPAPQIANVAHPRRPPPLKPGIRNQVVELQRLNDVAGRVALLNGVAARQADVDMAHVSDPETILAESAAVSFGHCS